MKRFTLLLIFAALGFGSTAQTIDTKRIDFVNKFYLAVVDHNQKKVIKMMDKTYRKEQIKFLGGNKEQFVNEIFGGNDAITAKFHSIKLKDIENIEIQDVYDRGENEWEYVFHVKSGEILVECSLTLRKSGKKYGFVAAAG